MFTYVHAGTLKSPESRTLALQHPLGLTYGLVHRWLGLTAGKLEHKMVDLNLTYVDELISVRQVQHGGARGAPKKVEDGSREGASINRSVVVMLSALLQVFVQDVFRLCAQQALPSLQNDQVWDSYWKEMKGWGNPSTENTKRLFLKIGVEDVFGGLSWQKCENATVRRRLDELNHVRNSIAHGAEPLRVNASDYALTLAKAKAFRNFAEQFAARFEGHALGKM